MRPTILCVDDEPDLLEMLVEVLQHEGYAAEGVGTAERALERLHTEHFDVLLTDFNLPGHTGLWLLEQAADAGLLATTKALICTANYDVPDGAAKFGVLTKPVDFAKLSHVIEAALAEAGMSTAPTNASPEIELVLYVSRDSVASLRASRTLARVLADFDGVTARIVDVAADPQGAAEDRVDFTPTLVRRTPTPKRWLIGDLRNVEPLEQLLELSGARSKKP